MSDPVLLSPQVFFLLFSTSGLPDHQSGHKIFHDLFLSYFIRVHLLACPALPGQRSLFVWECFRSSMSLTITIWFTRMKSIHFLFALLKDFSKFLLCRLFFWKSSIILVALFSQDSAPLFLYPLEFRTPNPNPLTYLGACGSTATLSSSIITVCMKLFATIAIKPSGNPVCASLTRGPYRVPMWLSHLLVLLLPLISTSAILRGWEQNDTVSAYYSFCIWNPTSPCDFWSTLW